MKPNSQGKHYFIVSVSILIFFSLLLLVTSENPGLSAGDESMGGGVIRPQYEKYELIYKNESFHYFIQLNLGSIKLTPDKGEDPQALSLTYSKGYSVDQTRLALDNDPPIAENKFVIPLSGDDRVYDIGNGGVILKGIADKYCENYCEVFFDIVPESNVTPGIEIYFDKPDQDYELFYFDAGWQPVLNEEKFKFVSAQTSKFKLNLTKESHSSLKWGVRAIGENLDPVLTDLQTDLVVYRNVTAGKPYHRTHNSTGWSGEHSDISESADIEWVVMETHPTEDEKIMCTGDV